MNPTDKKTPRAERPEGFEKLPLKVQRYIDPLILLRPREPPVLLPLQ